MNVSLRNLIIANTFWKRVTIFAAIAVVLSIVVQPVSGHQHTAPWLNESSLDNGLYVEVRHPRVIRNPGPFEVSVLMKNLLAEADVVIKEVRYFLPGTAEAVVHPRQDVLASKRFAYRQYKSIQQQLRNSTEMQNRAAVERLYLQRQALLINITRGTFRDRQRIGASLIPEVGLSFHLTVEIDVLQAGQLRTVQRLIEIPVQQPLPVGIEGAWFAGDQHLHTAFSIDALFLEGTAELTAAYAETAQTIGLDWIIITDHTNLNFAFWYKPWMFNIGELLARHYRNKNDYLVLQGQEMGVGSIGAFGEAAHLLVYPRTADSTGFLQNPCSGLLFNHINCEPEQVIIDRVNDNGGIGFIAHPFDFAPLSYAQWDQASNAAGWAGIEIFNSDVATFEPEDQQSIDWWHEMLNEIAPPQGGQLAQRADFPTRFPVGIGNSDAHQPALIGNTFTYIRLPGNTNGNGMLSREDLMDAFVNGRCVASNGPLVFGQINGAGTGEVAIVSAKQNQLAVTLQTTSEFGPVGDYQITVLVNGLERTVIPPSGSPDHQTTIVLDNLLSPPDKFVTLRAERANCIDCVTSGVVFQAIANPIWLEFSTSDPVTSD
ncbi:MAG: PHP domain-containing protein [Deltaproteobacteria bacterium]|nr:MAG: PHP domain-containing protein [Deltaproteobacteria bacterium]